MLFRSIQSDTLSRRPDHGKEEEHDNENITVLPEGLFINLIDTELLDRITGSNELDKDAIDAIKTLFEAEPKTLRHTIEDWTVKQHEGKNILLYKG